MARVRVGRASVSSSDAAPRSVFVNDGVAVRLPSKTAARSMGAAEICGRRCYYAACVALGLAAASFAMW